MEEREARRDFRFSFKLSLSNARAQGRVYGKRFVKIESGFLRSLLDVLALYPVCGFSTCLLTYIYVRVVCSPRARRKHHRY